MSGGNPNHGEHGRFSAGSVGDKPTGMQVLAAASRAANVGRANVAHPKGHADIVPSLAAASRAANVRAGPRR